MPFGLRTRVGPGNHVIDGGPDPHEKGRPIAKNRDTAVICAKTAERMEMLLGVILQNGSLPIIGQIQIQIQGYGFR